MSAMEREQVLKIASENLNIKKHSKKLNNTNKVYLTYKWGNNSYYLYELFDHKKSVHIQKSCF